METIHDTDEDAVANWVVWLVLGTPLGVFVVAIVWAAFNAHANG